MRQTAAALLIGSAAPSAYTELVLCRDIYHCTPLELDRIPLARVKQHLAALAGERRAQEIMRQHELQRLRRSR